MPRFLLSGLFILKSEALPLPVCPPVLAPHGGAGTDGILWRPADIKEHVKQIEKAVSGKEPRFVLRALRALPSTSRRLNTNVVNKTICGFFTNNSTTRDFLLSFLEEVSPPATRPPPGPAPRRHADCALLWDQPMEMADGDVQFRPRTGKAASAPLLPEVEAYLQLLLVVHLTNNKRYAEVSVGRRPPRCCLTC